MTAPALDPLTMSRLALIRLLYIQGIEQSKLPVPLVYSGVLTLHDTVELFLVLAADHLGANVPDHLSFTKYWEKLDPAALGPRGVVLPGKGGMDRLNRLRNGFKHAGTLPGVPAVEQARAEVTAFLEDATPLVFSIPFGDVDMADVVPQADARAKLKQAAAENSAGTRIEAMASLVEAFELVFEPHTKANWMEGSALSFGHDSFRQVAKYHYERLASHIDDRGMLETRTIAEEWFRVSEATTALQAGMRVLALGIDYAQYHRFDAMTPGVSQDHNRSRLVFHAKTYAPRDEDFQWCYQFVVTSALRSAEVDAYVAGLPDESRAAGVRRF